MDEGATKARPPRKAYKIRGPETWALIRESYLAGAPAKVLAERYDVTTWAIWRRAWREKWTKQDRVEPPPPPPLGSLTAGLEPDAGEAAELARAALQGVASAMRQSRFDEARQALMRAELERIVATPGLSKDVFEQASKSLA